jgi:3-deoxy-D-manno-octulosonate 8-phosphate phosphatase (KDO 8-P phosphatase)
MAELGVANVIQGCKDKVAALDILTAELGISATQCIYVGDDIPDLPLLKKVGYAVAVANAVAEVQQQCDYTTVAAGGHGAVREVCELLLAAQGGAQS